MNLVLTVLMAVSTATAAPAMAGPSFDLHRLDELMYAMHDATGHPFGTAVAVVKDGEVIYEGYFGYRDIGQGMPVTRETGFYIASATKPFVALTALLQEHDGVIDTNTSLQQMFPDMRFERVDATNVTAKDLLVHTSGIDNPPLVWATAFSGIHDPQSLRQLIARSEPGAAARGTFDYTNVGYNIVSVWLDKQLGARWQDELDTRIFQPLEMHRTSAYISEADDRGWPLAQPYSFASTVPDQALYLAKADDTMQAAGGMISTAPDLAKFLIAQFPPRVPGGNTTLPATVMERSHIPQAPVETSYLDFPRTGYAWGWYTGPFKDRTMLHHFGGFAGFHAHLSFIPEDRIGLVVLNNDDFLGAQVTNLIADLVYGVLLQQPDIQARAAARFDDLQTKARGFRDSAQARREEINARTWNLSLPRAAYAGRYANPLLGNMTVVVDADQDMQIRWGRLATTATGDGHSDQVRVEFSPNSGNFLSFRLDGERVEAALFEGMEFVRVR